MRRHLKKYLIKYPTRGRPSATTHLKIYSFLVFSSSDAVDDLHLHRYYSEYSRLHLHILRIHWRSNRSLSGVKFCDRI